jgi:thiol-disulfide isomerase/thioredoxin
MRAVKVVVFLAIVFLGGSCWGDGSVGENAPEITIREWITNNPPTLEGLAGSVYVLEFWATWCHSCVENIPHLITLSDKYSDRGLKLIALSQDRSAEKVRRLVRERAISYDVALDDGTSDLYGIRGYPTAVVVSHKGRIVWRGYPWSSEFEEAIEAALWAGPPPLLVGVDLGPFRHLRKALWGGREFAKAYHEIEAFTDNHDEPGALAVAERIIKTIDQRISQKIRQADQLRASDPVRAYEVYAGIVGNYYGIEVVQAAKAAYLELRNCKEVKRYLSERDKQVEAGY